MKKHANIINVVNFFVISAVWAAVILLVPVLVTALEESFQHGFPSFNPTWNATMALINLRYCLIALLAGVVINGISKLISAVRHIGKRKP